MALGLAGGIALLNAACGPSSRTPETSRASFYHEARKSSAARRLEADGIEGRVCALTWGRGTAARRLAVAFEGGQFASYRPDVQAGPKTRGHDAGPIRAILPIAAAGLITAGPDGLVAWDGGELEARRLQQADTGPVLCLLADPENENEFLAGLADGRILRGRWQPDAAEPITVLTLTNGPRRKGSSGIRTLGWTSDGRGLFATYDDGRAYLLDRTFRDAGGEIATGSAVISLDEPARFAVVGEGPSLRIFRRGDHRAGGAWSLERCGPSLDYLKGSNSLVISGDDRILLWPIGAATPGPVRVIADLDGPAIVSVDPEDDQGRRLALGGPRGRVEILDENVLRDRSTRLASDELPGLAYRPELRFDRPRPRPAPEREGLAEGPTRTMVEAQALLDTDQIPAALGLLRAVEGDPALDRSAAAEVAVLLAAARQRAGATRAELRPGLEWAIEAFALAGDTVREADLRFWLGHLLAPPFAGTRVGSSEPERALEQLTAAAALARRSPGLGRQAVLADLLRSWTLLQIDEVAEAGALFERVERERAADPVLRRVNEIDRVGLSLDLGRGDMEAGAERASRLLGLANGEIGERLLREIRLDAARALASLGRWAEASRVLDIERPEDPEWELRRLTAKARNGSAALPTPSDDQNSALEWHVRGRLLAASPRFERARADLARAAEIYRSTGPHHLLREIELERGELAERLGRHDEAAELYRQSLRAGAELGGATQSAAGHLAARAHRGLARCQLLRGQAPGLLATLERASWSRWVDRQGDGEARAAAAYLPLTASVRALEWSRARFDALGLGDPADPAPWARARGLETSILADSLARPVGDPASPFDLASLRLADHEAVLVFQVVAQDSMVGVLIRGRRPPQARPIPGSLAEIRRSVWSWRRRLGDGGRGVHHPAPAGSEPWPLLTAEPALTLPKTVPPAGTTWEAHLDDLLIAPFQSGLDGVAQLTIIPDDALAALPFEILGRSQSLRDRQSLRLLPSLGLFRLAGSRLETTRSVRTVWIGGEPGQGEAAALRSSYESTGWRSVDPAAGAALDPRALAEELAAADILHLQGPMALDPGRCPSGGIELTLAPDVRWPANRILTIPLKAQVVVLVPGPEPVDRPNLTGEGLRDLAQTWLSAGAKSVILALWSPPESSREVFLGELHRSLAAGRSATMALDRAREEVQGRAAFRDPVHWAGFVVYGAP